MTTLLALPSLTGRIEHRLQSIALAIVLPVDRATMELVILVAKERGENDLDLHPPARTTLLLAVPILLSGFTLS